jgi:hypothetical protein
MVCGGAGGRASARPGARWVASRRGAPRAPPPHDGLWEITGRRSRFGKVLGLRLDLDRIESELGPGSARAVAPGGRLHLFTSDPGSVAGLPERVGGIVALPRAAVQVHRIDEVPRTPNGKVDYATLNAWASVADAAGASAEAAAGGLAEGASAEALRTVYATVLGRPEATVDDSFVSLGGDSLSFVEIASLAVSTSWTAISPRSGKTPVTCLA